MPLSYADTWLTKGIYLSRGTYIPFIRNLYTSRWKPIYLLREGGYRSLSELIRAYPSLSELIRLILIDSDLSLLASILLNPLYNAMQYLVFLSILFVEEQNNSDL